MLENSDRSGNGDGERMHVDPKEWVKKLDGLAEGDSFQARVSFAGRGNVPDLPGLIYDSFYLSYDKEEIAQNDIGISIVLGLRKQRLPISFVMGLDANGAPLSFFYIDKRFTKLTPEGHETPHAFEGEALFPGDPQWQQSLQLVDQTLHLIDDDSGLEISKGAPTRSR